MLFMQRCALFMSHRECLSKRQEERDHYFQWGSNNMCWGRQGIHSRPVHGRHLVIKQNYHQMWCVFTWWCLTEMSLSLKGGEVKPHTLSKIALLFISIFISSIIKILCLGIFLDITVTVLRLMKIRFASEITPPVTLQVKNDVTAVHTACQRFIHLYLWGL